MPEIREDDLFRESTMTFGQHLGELARLSVEIGGRLAGGLHHRVDGWRLCRSVHSAAAVVRLDRYYQKESIDLAQNGPWTREQVQTRVEKEHLLADEVYVDPSQMFQELKNAYPDQFKSVPALQPKKTTDSGQAKSDTDDSNLIRIFLWHRSADDPREQIKSFNAQEPFSVYVKASLLVGVLLASPWIFYQIWNFVAAGLYPHERQYVHLYLPFSLGLFLAGAAAGFLRGVRAGVKLPVQFQPKSRDCPRSAN